MKSRKSTGVLMMIAVFLLAILLMDIWVMFSQIRQQTKDAGISQLSTVSGEFEGTMSDAEILTMEIAIEAQELLGDKKELKKYIRAKQDEVAKGDTGIFHVYIAGSDWAIMPEFDFPDDYVPTERLWYTGAIQNDGKPYVSPPYQDAVTGDVCFSVSVMLGDGDTVLATDYHMDTIQKYIAKMYDEGNQHAVIVTDNGVIAGCSDEKYLGRDLAHAMPEYAGILALAKKSDGLVTARNKTDFLYENLFAARSGKGWYMIISIHDWELYRSSYIQLFLTAALAVALFITVILVYVIGRRRKWFDNTPMGEEEHVQRFQNQKKKENIGVNKKYRRRILIFMILVMVFSLYTNISAAYRWGSAQMKNEADQYTYHLSEWVDTQKSILDMFVSTISTNPRMLKDYDGTIAYLDRITDQYPDISATYIGSARLDPTVFMNNGWKPEKGWDVQERPWYVGAMESEEGWNITTPYYDDQTGGYCITISEQVHDAKSGEFLGVFGIDFYMDKLVQILGDSYTEKGYAFLVDTEGNIVNHPNEKYQMDKDNQASVLQLPYGEVQTDGVDTKFILDYDGSFKILLAMVDKTSNFTVYVVSDAWSIYGRVFIYGIICLAAFLICILMIYRILSNMIAWQDEVNRKLEVAARTDAMTGLMNKATTEEAIAAAVENGEGVFLILDLDSFKLVNDLYGHEMGDRVLIRFSDLLRSLIRDNDIAGRIGGDEFVAYCEGLMDEEVLAEKIAHMNREIVRSAKEYMGEDMEIPLGCSVGAALVPASGQEYGELFAKADLALNQAKKAGKHVLRVHHEERKEAKAETSTGDLANLRMVFGERNQKKSALVADKTVFRDVYRFMARYASNCSCSLHMVAFTLQGGESQDISAASDRFVALAADHLRSCDVVLKYSTKQILVLLVEASEGGHMIPIDRILDAWKEEGTSGITVSFQQESIGSI